MLSLRQGAETCVYLPGTTPVELMGPSPSSFSSVPTAPLLRHRRVHVQEHQRPQDVLHATPAPASPTRGATACREAGPCGALSLSVFTPIRLVRHVGLRVTVVCSRRKLDAASAHHHRVCRVRARCLVLVNQLSVYLTQAMCYAHALSLVAAAALPPRAFLPLCRCAAARAHTSRPAAASLRADAPLRLRRICV
jgi:hypothetical protein